VRAPWRTGDPRIPELRALRALPAPRIPLAAAAQPPLGTAANFAILAKSTITNVPTSPTAINGNLGLTGTSVTGFTFSTPPGLGVVTGVTHIADGTATTAQTDLANALVAAAGATPTRDLTGTDLGGLTLPPGVYHFSSTAALTGILTLDGQGDTNPTFIFQIGSTLTTTLNGGTSGNVLLTGGASPCNIYWQVVSSSTLGGETFYGNVLAYSSITINATTFTGRALAGGPSLGTGAVSIPVAGGSLITNPGGQ